MITVLQAQQTIDQHSATLQEETVPLGQAHGRVLHEPVAATEDIPAFDRSAMDGYAIQAGDDAEEFEVVGEIRAGQIEDRHLKPGQAIRIFTGARLPGDGLKVVMQEHVEVREGCIRITKQNPNSNVRKRGEDARAGEILLQPGLALDATAVALMASVGKTSIQVSRLPRILHLTTGDEIVPPELKPGQGQIRNSNASLIAGLCREQGIAAVDHFHAGDDLPAMLKVFSDVRAETYDLILISGGSGQGAYDFSTDLFQHLHATIHFREIDVRPGKPLIFGTASSQIIFGLPGNALSHFVCFHLFVRRALDRLLVRAPSAPIQGFLSDTMTGAQNARETWWPAQTFLHEGRLQCRPIAWKSSGDITRLPSANALLHVPASTSSLPAGTMVNLLFTRNAHS